MLFELQKRNPTWPKPNRTATSVHLTMPIGTSGSDGADAMAALGEYAWVETVDCLAANLDQQVMRAARKDPLCAVDLWVLDNGNSREPVQTVPTSWIPDGARWRAWGQQCERAGDVIALGGEVFSFDQTSLWPVDNGSLRFPRVMPRLGDSGVTDEPAPF